LTGQERFSIFRRKGYTVNKPKRPRDTNQLAKSIVDLATEQNTRAIMSISSVSNYASELGRLGGLKGGKARAEKLTKAERVKIAKAGARARWGKRR
jgi:hypothetical protein